MVSSGLVTSCLALIAPASGFVSPIAWKAPGAQIAASSRASSVRQRAPSGSDLRMSFDYSDSEKERMRSMKTITMNIKTGEVYEQVKKEPPVEEEVPKDGPGLMGSDITLFCKAGADGKSLGDCPFAQYVQMVLHYKKLPLTLRPCGPDNKPSWLVDEFGGKMPCLVDNNVGYVESSKIVDYIEYFYPEPTLSIDGGQEAVVEAHEVASGLFGALAKCTKNLDSKDDASFLAIVNAELEKIDSFLKGTEGPYLCGEQMTTADCSLAPKLYHTSTCLAHFKNTVISPDLEALHKYMDAVFSTEAFEKSSYPPDVVVWGWNQSRGTAAK